MKRRQVLRTTGVVGTGMLGTGIFSNTTVGKKTSEGIDAYTEAFTTENLGPHNLSFAMGSAELIGNTIYLGSRISNPSGIASVNIDTGQGEFHEATHSQETIWGSTSVNGGNDIYFSTDDDLYHFDIVRNTITKVLHLDGVHHAWDTDSAPGDNKIFVGCNAPAQLWEYDPTTRKGGYVYGPKLTNAAFVRSVSVDAETIYAGTGKEAQLIAIDRDTEEKEVILYASNKNSVLSNETFVYELSNNGTTGDYLPFGTNGTPYVGYVNKNDYSDYQVAEVPNIHPVVEATNIQDDIIYFTAKFPATLYKYDISADEITQLAELPGIATRDIFVRNNKIIGAAQSNYVWTYDINSGSVESQNILNGSIEGIPQVAQSVSGYKGKGYVGASGQTSIHDAETGSVTQISAPGEPKSQEWVDGILYEACYSNGDLVKYNPETENSEIIPRVARSQLTGRVRPRATHYSRSTEKLYIGTEKDEVGGGDLVVFNPESDETANIYQDILGEKEVASITSLPHGNSDTIFVGSNSVREIDPNTGELLRELPSPNGRTIIGLTTLQRPRPGDPKTMDYIYGIRGTTLFAVDPDSESLVFKKDLPGGTVGKLRSHKGLIFGGGSNKMFVCDPSAEEVSIALDGLHGQWHNRHSIGVDENYAYVISDTDLLKVNLPKGLGKYFHKSPK